MVVKIVDNFIFSKVIIDYLVVKKLELYNKYFEGYFWIPEKEETKIISTLFIDEKGIATITSLKSLDNEGWNKLNLVLGYINCNENSKTYSIKLHDVHKTHQTIGVLTKFKYSSHKSLIASVFDNNINTTMYNSIMLSSDLINDWIPITGFDFKSSPDKFFEISQLYKLPEQIDLFKNKDFDISLSFRASTGFEKRRSSFIKENTYINIKTPIPFELSQLTKIKTTIERLLSIILFKPFNSNTIELSTTEKITYKIIEKLNRLEPSLGKEIDFKNFKNHSQNIFLRWFEKQSILELAIGNFFSVYGQKGVLVENKFLTYISILENFHKNNIHKKDYLKTRLKYLLEKSIIGNKINDIEKFSETLKTTRNYHVHLAEERKANSLTTQEIVTTNLLLEFVIREIFLREIELNENIQIPSKVQEYINVLNTK